jgi:hypothetical protein
MIRIDKIKKRVSFIFFSSVDIIQPLPTKTQFHGEDFSSPHENN